MLPLTVTNEMVFPSKVPWTMRAGESLDGKGIFLCLVRMLSSDVSVQLSLIRMALSAYGTFFWFVFSPSTSTVMDGWVLVASLGVKK